eukprot:921729_1
MAQDPNENKQEDESNDIKLPDWNGSWTLRTSEKLDEYLKDEGWGYIMRKAAAAVSAYQTITQDDKSIKINVKNKKGQYEYTSPFDGSEVKYVDNDKDDIVSTASIQNDEELGPCLVEVMIKGKEKKKYTTTRYMKDGEMCLKIANAGGKYCVRLFKKKKKK